MSDMILGMSIYTPLAASGGSTPLPLAILDVDSGGVSDDDPTRAIFNVPLEAVAGDVIVFFSSSRDSPDVHTISGGTGTATKIGEVNSTVGSSYSMAAFHYVVGAGDVPGTTAITIASTEADINFSVAAITVQGTSGVDVTGAPQQIGGFNTNSTAPSVNTTAGNCLVLFAVGQPTTSTYSSGTYTEQVEATIGSAGLAVYSFTKATAGSTGALSVTASASNYNYGATVALAP